MTAMNTLQALIPGGYRLEKLSLEGLHHPGDPIEVLVCLPDQIHPRVYKDRCTLELRPKVKHYNPRHAEHMYKIELVVDDQLFVLHLARNEYTDKMVTTAHGVQNEVIFSAYRQLRKWAKTKGVFDKAMGFLSPMSLMRILQDLYEGNLCKEDLCTRFFARTMTGMDVISRMIRRAMEEEDRQKPSDFFRQFKLYLEVRVSKPEYFEEAWMRYVRTKLPFLFKCLEETDRVMCYPFAKGFRDETYHGDGRMVYYIGLQVKGKGVLDLSAAQTRFQGKIAAQADAERTVTITPLRRKDLPDHVFPSREYGFQPVESKPVSAKRKPVSANKSSKRRKT